LSVFPALRIVTSVLNLNPDIRSGPSAVQSNDCRRLVKPSSSCLTKLEIISYQLILHPNFELQSPSVRCGLSPVAWSVWCLMYQEWIRMWAHAGRNFLKPLQAPARLIPQFTSTALNSTSHLNKRVIDGAERIRK
jgi:hypothetical protein